MVFVSVVVNPTLVGMGNATLLSTLPLLRTTDVYACVRSFPGRCRLVVQGYDQTPFKIGLPFVQLRL